MTSTFKLSKELEGYGITFFFNIEKPIVTIGHGDVNECTVDFTDEKAVLTQVDREKEKKENVLGPHDWYLLPTNNGVYRICANRLRQVIDPKGKPIFNLNHFPQECPTISHSGRYISYVILREINTTKSTLIDLQKRKIFEYEGLPANFSPDEKYFAYPLANEVFVCTSEDKKTIARHSFSKYNPHIKTVLMSNTHIVIIWQGFANIIVMKIGEKIETYTDYSADYHLQSHLYPDGTLLSVGTTEIKKIKLNFEEPKIESVSNVEIK